MGGLRVSLQGFRVGRPSLETMTMAKIEKRGSTWSYRWIHPLHGRQRNTFTSRGEANAFRVKVNRQLGQVRDGTLEARP